RRVLGEDEAPLQALSRAWSAVLIDEDASTPGLYRFSHALIRETLYADLPPADRIGVHRRVAAALEEIHANRSDLPLAELAHHFLQLGGYGEGAKAVSCSLEAGDRAMACFAYDEAVGHYERAIDSLGCEPSNDRSRLQLGMKLADAAWRAGDNVKSRSTLERT